MSKKIDFFQNYFWQLQILLKMDIGAYMYVLQKRMSEEIKFKKNYTHARNALIVTKRVERSRSIVIIKHKYMLMCNHKICINLMCCLKIVPHDVK